MSKYRVAVVGCGGRSRAHILPYFPPLSAGEAAEVVACCAPNPERREKVAAEFGLRAYADVQTMIEQEKPDLVHLVTWPDTRVELMTLVSDLGVPLCTVEKPIATGAADWRQLCALEKRTATRFAICHQMRWQKHLSLCRAALQSGAMGDVKFLDISAGMNIAGQGTHTLNYGRSLVGDAKVARVAGSAFGWDRSDKGHPAPAASEAYLTFETGLRALWTSGPISPRCGDPKTTWQHVRIAAYADQGRVNYEEFGKWEIVSPAGNECGHYGGMETWMANNLEAQSDFHQAMFDWLEDDRKVPGTSLEQSLHEWKVVLAVYTSALLREPVNLDSFEPEDDLFHALEAALS
jgi:predicted dehydrogenase